MEWLRVVLRGEGFDFGFVDAISFGDPAQTEVEIFEIMRVTRFGCLHN